jgi:hypothetical protein
LPFFLVAGCAIEDPVVPVGDAGSCTPVMMRIAATNEIDVLFVIDNSFPGPLIGGGLDQSFHDLTDAAAALAAMGGSVDLHLGVVTTDYGAGATGSFGCVIEPSGQRALLQGLGPNAPNTCKAPVGGNYLSLAYASDGKITSNAPLGQDVATTFECMTAVGGNGCGFTMPLEVSYAALQQAVPENAGFLREEAQLVVVYLTDKDDCSAPADSLVFENKGQLGYEDHFRCFHFGVECGPSLTLPAYDSSNGPIAGCVPAFNQGDGDTGRLADVSRYIHFFGQPGGVKRNPADVTLIAFAGPEDPPQVILTSPFAAPPYATCPMVDEMSNPPCLPREQLACSNGNNPELWHALPTIRLKSVLDGAANQRLFSYCDATLDPTIQAIAEIATTTVPDAPHCVPYALMDPDHPDCVVEDVTVDGNDKEQVVALQQCDGTTMPCFLLERRHACDAISPDGIGITLQRSTPLGIGWSTRVTCARQCR